MIEFTLESSFKLVSPCTYHAISCVGIHIACLNSLDEQVINTVNKSTRTLCPSFFENAGGVWRQVTQEAKAKGRSMSARRKVSEFELIISWASARTMVGGCSDVLGRAAHPFTAQISAVQGHVSVGSAVLSNQLFAIKRLRAVITGQSVSTSWLMKPGFCWDVSS